MPVLRRHPGSARYLRAWSGMEQGAGKDDDCGTACLDHWNLGKMETERRRLHQSLPDGGFWRHLSRHLTIAKDFRRAVQKTAKRTSSSVPTNVSNGLLRPRPAARFLAEARRPGMKAQYACKAATAGPPFWRKRVLTTNQRAESS